MNINYLLLISDKEKNAADVKKWYVNKKHTEFFLPELKLSFFSFCLAERLQKPYFDYKVHMRGLDPHLEAENCGSPNYMRATIHTNVDPEEIRRHLDFCPDYYDIQHYDISPSLADIFVFKFNLLHDLARVYSRVMFLDLDTVVRKSLAKLNDSKKIYFYSNEGMNILKYYSPSETFIDLCKQNDLSLDISTWNTGFVSAPSKALQDVKLAEKLYSGFLEAGMVEPIAEQATLTLLLVNYARRNNLAVKQCLEYVDHYWYHGARKYRDMWDL